MEETIGLLSSADSSTLDGIYRWGIALIKGIQTIESPALTVVIKGITALGTGLFYIPLILFIFWCVDEKQGARFCVLILLTSWVNGFFKDLLKQPRPYNLDPSVGRAAEPTYGIPSGHAQMSLVFWLSAAPWAAQGFGRDTQKSGGRRVFWIAAIAVVIVIAVTRLYLGVHFPTDIAAGWLRGGLILVLYFLLGNRVESLLAAGGVRFQMITAAIVVLLMNYSGVDSSLGGIFLGFAAGYSLMKKHVGFTARGPVRGIAPGAVTLLLRYVIGVTGFLIIYLVLRALLPGGDSLFRDIPGWGEASPYSVLGRFLRYGALGLWGGAGAPWLFCRLGLASVSANGDAGGEHRIMP
jgi:membrane-associated phospholipid phosphatase